MLVDPDSARSLILHALTQRPFMTTTEVVEACPKVPYVFVSFYIDDSCETCEPYFHRRTATASIEYYTLRFDAYRLLKTLERRGQVRQIKIAGVQKSAWSIVPASERIHGETKVIPGEAAHG